MPEPNYAVELTPPDIEPYRAGNTGIDYVTSFDSGQPGQHVLVTALTHGNEICGAIALDRLLRAELRPRRGRLTLAFDNVAAYRSFDRLRDRNRFRAWLVRISFRLALDRLRSSKRREQRDVLWSQPAHQPPAATAEDLAASSEFQAHLDRALEELPEKLRLVLLLAAMEGHTIDEVAKLLGIPVGTVKSRIFVARKQLAEKLRCHVNITKTR